MKRILAAVLAASLLVLTACNDHNNGAGADGGDQGGETASGVAVQVETIQATDISNENRVSGRVTSEDQTAVMVGTTAQVTKVYVETGDVVRAGDRLCTLDIASTLDSYRAAIISRDSAKQSYDDQAAVFDAQIALYDTQMALANAQIETLNTQIAMAEKNLSDLTALKEIGAAAQIELDQAQLSLDQAKAGLDQARSEVDQLQLAKLSSQAQKNSTLAQLEAGVESYQSNVDQLAGVLENVDSAGSVVAPASGTIITLNAVESGMVSPSSPVAVIDSADQLKVAVAVSEALIPRLAVGDEADVTIGAVDLTYVGAIRNIERNPNAQTGLYTVSVSVPADAAGLLTGMFADVTFRTDTSYNAIVAPTEAILTSGDVQYVYVVENDAAKYVEVTTGLTGNGVTEVLSGLKEGQQLVTVGQSYLSDGDSVRIVSGEAS